MKTAKRVITILSAVVLLLTGMVFAVSAEDAAPVQLWDANGMVNSYATVCEALADYDCATQYMVLAADVEEDIVLSSDLYIDLNGNDLSGTLDMNGHTLYGMDATTNEYSDAQVGTLRSTLTGAPAVHFKEDGTRLGEVYRYMAVQSAEGYTFHRFYLGLSHISLQPAYDAIGFKAIFKGDDTVAAQLDTESTAAYGISLLVNGEVVSDWDETTSGVRSFGFGAERFADKSEITMRIAKFFARAEYAQIPVNGKAFMKLNNGDVITGSNYDFTMRSVVEDIHGAFGNYSDKQRYAVQEMCVDHIDTTGSWDIENILSFTKNSFSVADNDPFENNCVGSHTDGGFYDDGCVVEKITNHRGTFYQNTKGATFTTAVSVDEQTEAALVVKVCSAGGYSYAYHQAVTKVLLNGSDDGVTLHEAAFSASGWDVDKAARIVVAKLSLKPGVNTVSFTMGTDTEYDLNVAGIDFLTPATVNPAYSLHSFEQIPTIATAPNYTAEGQMQISSVCSVCGAESENISYVTIPAISDENGYTKIDSEYPVRWQYTYEETDFIIEVIEADVMEEGVEYSQEFNTDVFYRNDLYFSSPDPAVIQCTDIADTENYGKYFMFSTIGSFGCYESTDLVNWKPKAASYVWDEDGWQLNSGWAPEVIWDEFADPADYGLVDTDGGKGVYFMFCSANPGAEIEANRVQRFVLDLAVATCPYGPYVTWTGVEKGTVIDGIDYGTEAAYATYTNYAQSYANGTYAGYVGREDNKVTVDDPWWNSPAASASLNYQYTHRDLAGQPDPDNGGKVVNEAAAYMVINEGYNADGGVWFSCIDPTPFLNYNEMIEVNGVLQPKKYMFFTRDQSVYNNVTGEDGETAFFGTCVYAVSFINNDWAQVDYNSLTRITRTKYNFISQAAADAYVADAKAFDANQYVDGFQEIASNATAEEIADTGKYTLGLASVEEYIRPGGANNINEGSQLSYNEDTGLYYLTISIGQYKSNTYSVIQLTAYDIMGPYRKLDLDEGGLVLTTNKGISVDNMTGTGHHSMFSCGDELLMLYHRHLNVAYSGSDRGYCLDRVNWVKNRDGLTVMHVNGPTSSIQPLVFGTGATEYDIITDEAAITTTAQDCNDVKYLSDSVIKFHPDNLQAHLSEFAFKDEEATITLTYKDYTDVVALQIFNSRDIDSAFDEIYKIEMDVLVNGVKGTAVINNLQFDKENALFASGAKIRPGYSANAVFNEIAVKEIRITIKNNHAGNAGSIAIPEIYVIGRPNVSAANEFVVGASDVEVVQTTVYKDLNISKYHAPTVEYQTYGDITVDGVIGEQWEEQNKLVTNASINGIDHAIELSSYFAEEGLVLYAKVTGAPAYYNPSRWRMNTAISFIIETDADPIDNEGPMRIEVYPGKLSAVYRYDKRAYAGTGYHGYPSEIDHAYTVDGTINNASNNGYTVECMIPWSIIGEESKPERVYIDPVIQYCQDETVYACTNHSLAVYPRNDSPAYDRWYQFTETGYQETCLDGHVYGSYSILSEPTYTTEGTIVRCCELCPYYETKSIPVVSEDNGYTVLVRGVMTRWQYAEEGMRLIIDTKESLETTTYSFAANNAFVFPAGSNTSEWHGSGYYKQTSGDLFTTTVNVSSPTAVSFIIQCGIESGSSYNGKNVVPNLTLNGSADGVRFVETKTSFNGWTSWVDFEVATLFLEAGENIISFNPAKDVNIKAVAFKAVEEIKMISTADIQSFLIADGANPFDSTTVKGASAVMGTNSGFTLRDNNAYEKTQGATFTTTVRVEDAVNAYFYIYFRSKGTYSSEAAITSITVNGKTDAVELTGEDIACPNWQETIHTNVAKISLQAGENVICFTMGSENINVWGIGFLSASTIKLALQPFMQSYLIVDGNNPFDSNTVKGASAIKGTNSGFTLRDNNAYEKTQGATFTTTVYVEDATEASFYIYFRSKGTYSSEAAITSITVNGNTDAVELTGEDIVCPTWQETIHTNMAKITLQEGENVICFTMGNQNINIWGVGFYTDETVELALVE